MRKERLDTWRGKAAVTFKTYEAGEPMFSAGYDTRQGPDGDIKRRHGTGNRASFTALFAFHF